MSALQEIRDRHARDAKQFERNPYGTPQEHFDRATLLAEVDRLNAFVEKVRASRHAGSWETHPHYNMGEIDAALTELRASK